MVLPTIPALARLLGKGRFLSAKSASPGRGLHSEGGFHRGHRAARNYDETVPEGRVIKRCFPSYGPSIYDIMYKIHPRFVIQGNHGATLDNSKHNVPIPFIKPYYQSFELARHLARKAMRSIGGGFPIVERLFSS